MSESSESGSPSPAETRTTAEKGAQPNSALEKRLALELSRFTAKKSVPSASNLMLLSSDSSVEAAVTSMAAVVQAVQKQQHLTGQQQLALAVQAAQTSIGSTSQPSVSQF